ncbi:pseudouridylate synthase TRUB2, mitochondrial [Leptopilina boulardi]|uniref:pseudouridylate synthase TRUB2, mitochondrial n=1 Tax=Leptopilina boulardi TaxID=63433 RepID=UPI0021F6280F|nr:pseudouridylate synthase TRUB2, mitochondrial [Leptopilina boulardi]
MPNYTNDARVVWKMLNGLFVIYKPVNVPLLLSRKTICKNLCADLNNMKVRPPDPYVLIEGESNKQLTVSVRSSYADNILVVGPRYQESDIRINYANHLQQNSSGIIVCGLNNGTKLAYKLKQTNSTRSYRIKGILGQATDNCFITGRIVEKSNYKFLRRSHIDRICAAMQSSHQKKMFELCGVDIQSQAAYELAVKGLIRPVDNNVPMIYSIKCVNFIPPEFTLEIVCINEDEKYFTTLINELGMELRSTATCSQIQCFQYGLFNLNHALLSKHWNLQNIMKNLENSEKILEENPHLLNQYHPNLIQKEDVSLIESQERQYLLESREN